MNARSVIIGISFPIAPSGGGTGKTLATEVRTFAFFAVSIPDNER